MAMKYLGETFDLHGGGLDLVFPHHENELAQSEAATGRPFVRYWLHHGLLTIDQEKMSKSLGNFFTVKEVLARFPAEVVRFFLINSHYRSPLDFSDAALAEAETALVRLYTPLARLRERLWAQGVGGGAVAQEEGLVGLANEEREKLATLRERFSQAMADDLNSALALGYLFEAVRLINRLLEQPSAEPGYAGLLRRGYQDLVELGGVLNLLQADPAEMLRILRQERQDLAISPAEIEELIQRRSQARREKDWVAADAIRQQLAAKDIILEDTPQGTIWRVK